MGVKTVEKDKWLIFYIDGRLDVKLSQDLDSMVSEKINEGKYFILFNLGKTEYLSSSGLRVFISSLRKLNQKNGELRLSNMKESVRKILQIVDLENVFNIFSTEEQALK